MLTALVAQMVDCASMPSVTERRTWRAGDDTTSMFRIITLETSLDLLMSSVEFPDDIMLDVFAPYIDNPFRRRFGRMLARDWMSLAVVRAVVFNHSDEAELPVVYLLRSRTMTSMFTLDECYRLMRAKNGYLSHSAAVACSVNGRLSAGDVNQMKKGYVPRKSSVWGPRARVTFNPIMCGPGVASLTDGDWVRILGSHPLNVPVAAQNPATPVRVLEQIASSANETVMYALDMNPACPDEVRVIAALSCGAPGLDPERRHTSTWSREQDVVNALNRIDSERLPVSVE